MFTTAPSAVRMASTHSAQSASHPGEFMKPGAVFLVTSTCTGIPGTTNFSWSPAAAVCLGSP